MTAPTDDEPVKVDVVYKSPLKGLKPSEESPMKSSKKSKSAAENPWVMAVVAALGEDKLSPAALKHLVKNLHKYAGMAFAAVSTSVSVYTGLKDFL
jgi:hypothetical protein